MIPFISRHIPTAAQVATVEARFGDLVCAEPVVFEPGSVSDQMMAAIRPLLSEHVWTCDDSLHDHDDLSDDLRVVAGVFPGWALLELLRSRWTVVEFVNESSARQRGAFVCRGAFVHERLQPNAADPSDLLRSTFIACPVPVSEQQEAGSVVNIRGRATCPIGGKG